MNNDSYSMIIKVFSGENLIAEPPKLRFIRIMPDGTMGATYKKKVYPLYLGHSDKLVKINFDKLCRLSKELEPVESCINLNDDSYEKDSCPVLTQKSANLKEHQSRGQYILRYLDEKNLNIVK